MPIIVAQFKALFDRDLKQLVINFVTFFEQMFELVGGAIGRQIDRLKGVGRAVAGFFGFGDEAGSGASAANRVGLTPAAASAAAGGGGGTTVISGDTQISVEVNATPGMGVNDLGEVIPREMRKALDAENRRDAQSFITEAP